MCHARQGSGVIEGRREVQQRKEAFMRVFVARDGLPVWAEEALDRAA